MSEDKKDCKGREPLQKFLEQFDLEHSQYVLISFEEKTRNWKRPLVQTHDIKPSDLLGIIVTLLGIYQKQIGFEVGGIVEEIKDE